MGETVVKKKNANIELLRMLSMVMVVMLHALGKSNLLVNVFSEPSLNGVIAWILEALSISAVNIFMLISGYFLIDSHFKMHRLFEIVFQMLFYSIGAYVICFLFGIDTGFEFSIYHILQVILPFHMDVFWFLTAYIFIYMLLPIIQAGVKSITKKSFGITIICLTISECLFKTILPVRLDEDQFGYNFLWFLIVFLIGSYFKLYGFKHIKKSGQGLILFFASSALIVLEVFAIDFVVTKYGRLSEISHISTEYNHIFTLMAAIGIFSCFLLKQPMSEKVGRVICFMSPMSLGVYLIHENMTIRYSWQRWMVILDSLHLPTYVFIGRIFLSVIVVFVAGMVVDYCRIKLFSLIRKVFGKKNEA